MNKLILAAAVLLALLSGPSGTDAFEAPSDERLSGLLVEFEGYAVRAMKDWEIPGMAISIVRGDRVWAYDFTFEVSLALCWCPIPTPGDAVLKELAEKANG